MSDSDLMFRAASELAAMVRSGEISSRELVQTSLERIEELNPVLNAFVQVDAEGALAAADAIEAGDERPFAGVPIAIKNNRPVKGLRLTYGCPLMAEYVAPYDHNITRRLRDAGFVIVGTTTLPEYGILPVSEAQHLRPDAQSVGPAAHARRLLGRRRGGRGGRPGAGRARQRRRRLDPHPGGVLRPRRAQAGARPHLAGARARRLLAGDRRGAHAHRRRHGGDPRRARRLRARRCDLGAAAGPAVRGVGRR